MKLRKGIFEKPLIPRADNFTPPSRTPWGGKLIAKLKAKSNLIDETFHDIVGESWEISGHPSFPNIFEIEVEGKNFSISIKELGKKDPEKLFGKRNIKRFGEEMPFLTKLINSADWAPFKAKLKKIDAVSEFLNKDNHELHKSLAKYINETKDSEVSQIYREMLYKNLSIQVHPPEGYSNLNKGEHPKTEAWIILKKEEGAGIYIGLKENITKDMMQKLLECDEDITDYLNFVKVNEGDVFFIPAGTPHAIGAGLFLYEPQETSETTYRYYDYDRLDDSGHPRHLDIKDALAVTNWNAPRGEKFINIVKRQPKIISSGSQSAKEEVLLDESVFKINRLTFQEGSIYQGNSNDGIQGITIIKGSVILKISDGTSYGPFPAGQSIIIPAAMGEFTLVGDDKESVLLQTKE